MIIAKRKQLKSKIFCAAYSRNGMWPSGSGNEKHCNVLEYTHVVPKLNPLSECHHRCHGSERANYLRWRVHDLGSGPWTAKLAGGGGQVQWSS